MDEKTKAATTAERDEFVNLPLSQIYRDAQIRTDINLEDDAFRAMAESIRNVGVLEPVITTKSLRADAPAAYLLISGERRYLACLQLGLETIPAIVKPNVKTLQDVLAIQLTENLHRKDLNALDEAGAYLRYFQGRHPDMNLDGVINAMMNYRRDQNRVDNEFTLTVGVIQQFSGKSTSSIQNTLSLLKLPEDIREAVKTGGISVSQGYIFAANLDSPALMRTFNDALEKQMTNNALKMAFVTAAQAGKAKTMKKPQPVQRLRNNIKSVRNIIEIQVSKLAPKEMTDLLADMESLAKLIRQELDRQANEASRISAKKEEAAMIKAAAADKKRALEAAAAAAGPPASDAPGAPADAQVQQTSEQPESPNADAEPPAVKPAQKSKTKTKTTTKKTAKKKVLL